MRNALHTCMIASLLTLSSCAGRLPSGTARAQIAALGDADLVPSDVQVERIVTQTETRAVAETSVKLAFEFERGSDGTWQIVAARLGDGRWLEMETLLAALERQQIEETREALEQLGQGVEAYRNTNGSLPDVAPTGYLSDVLHPLFITDLVREDAWGGEIRYETSDSQYSLRSAGPDGIAGNGDDIVVRE